MKMKWLCGALAAVVIGYAGLSGWVIASQDVHELLVCASDGGLRIPAARSLCRRWLFAFRGTPTDVAALQAGGGANFILNQGPWSARMREELAFFHARGLDLDPPDEAGVTPLQSAVLDASADKVAWLLAAGADPNASGPRLARTPLQLALELAAAGRLEADGELIARLRTASGATSAHPRAVPARLAPASPSPSPAA